MVFKVFGGWSLGFLAYCCPSVRLLSLFSRLRLKCHHHLHFYKTTPPNGWVGVAKLLAKLLACLASSCLTSCFTSECFDLRFGTRSPTPKPKPRRKSPSPKPLNSQPSSALNPEPISRVSAATRVAEDGTRPSTSQQMRRSPSEPSNLGCEP